MTAITPWHVMLGYIHLQSALAHDCAICLLMIIVMIHVEDVFIRQPIYTMTCAVLHACGCYLQFNRDASRIAFLHNASNCSADTTSLQAQDTASSSVHNSVSLVTMDVTGKGLWVLPFKDVVYYEYGRGGKLIVSTQHGLFEADALGHSIQELKPPTIGQMLQSLCKGQRAHMWL